MMNTMTIEEKLHLCKLAVAIAVINFVAFGIGETIIGGVADLSRSGAGHYFVANHEKFHEVGFPIYIYAELHFWSMIATHLMAFKAARFYNKHKPPE